MHSHIHAMGANLGTTYSPRAVDRGESAQRAAEVRKKLLGSAAGEIEVSSEEDWMVLPGYEAAGYGRSGRRGFASDRKSDVEVEEAGEAVEPISVWA